MAKQDADAVAGEVGDSSVVVPLSSASATTEPIAPVRWQYDVPPVAMAFKVPPVAGRRLPVAG
ncbi:hypothetical protein ACWGKA_12750 [Streptomyces luteogriseus]